MTGVISSDEESDLSDGSSSDDDVPFTADANTKGYKRTDDCKGKVPVWKW